MFKSINWVVVGKIRKLFTPQHIIITATKDINRGWWTVVVSVLPVSTIHNTAGFCYLLPKPCMLNIFMSFLVPAKNHWILHTQHFSLPHMRTPITLVINNQSISRLLSNICVWMSGVTTSQTLKVRQNSGWRKGSDLDRDRTIGHFFPLWLLARANFRFFDMKGRRAKLCVLTYKNIWKT